MKTAINVLEKRMRKVTNKLKRKKEQVQTIGFQHQNFAVRNDVQTYIARCNNEIASLKKAILYLNQTETNLTNSVKEEIKEITNQQ